MPSYGELTAVVGYRSKNAAYKLVARLIDHGWLEKDETELVASFWNFSNLLKCCKKTESHAVRASGVCEPKNVAISAYLSHVLRQNTPHFSDCTALV